MKLVLKLEELAMLLFFSCLYFIAFHGTWPLFLWLFFVPDVSFIAYLISKKTGAIIYNLLHHKGILLGIFAAGYLMHYDLLLKTGLIFTAHSCFDRVAGYGLKYPDNFDHTHLGWIGKSSHKNQELS